MTPFIDFYKTVQGTRLQVSLPQRILYIYSEKTLRSTVHFSQSIKKPFSLNDLMVPNKNIGDLNYFVFPNGHNGKNWLWCAEISSIE